MCSRDGDGNVYAAAEAIQMLSDVAQIPMFSIVSHGMGKGFLGGEIVSQEQMGKRAGEMAVQILELSLIHIFLRGFFSGQIIWDELWRCFGGLCKMVTGWDSLPMAHYLAWGFADWRCISWHLPSEFCL